MLVCTIDEAFVDLGKHHDDFVLLLVRYCIIVHNVLIELYVHSQPDAFPLEFNVVTCVTA